MKKALIFTVATALLIMVSTSSFAWGRRGHQMVAELAFRFMDSTTKAMVQKYLGKMTPDEAGNWMDDERSNSFYTYMRTWHYLDVAKGETYKPSDEKNLLTVLYSALTELKGKDKMKDKDIKRDLLLIFHLVGDLHQPLHVGYPGDRGGNDVNVSSTSVSGNLHSIWDTQIIEYKDIQLTDILKYYDAMTADEIADAKKIGVMKWFNQNRLLLDTIYGFTDNKIDEAYIDRSAEIIKKQILLAGLRLASILTETFNPTPKTNAGNAWNGGGKKETEEMSYVQQMFLLPRRGNGVFGII